MSPASIERMWRDAADFRRWDVDLWMGMVRSSPAVLDMKEEVAAAQRGVSRSR